MLIQEDVQPRHTSVMHKIRHSSYGRMIFVHKRFRYLWLSGLISTIGNYLTQIALLSIIEGKFGKKEGSGLAVSGVYFATYIPAIIATPFAGVAADIFDKRKVMFIADFLRVFTALGYVVMLINVNELYWLIYVFLGLTMFCNAFFNPCREGLVPIVVPKDEVLIANALDGLTWMGTSFLGAFLGGLINSSMGPGPNFIANAVTFLISTLCVMRLFFFRSLKPENIQKKLALKHEQVREKTRWERLIDGVLDFFIGCKFILTHPYILSITCIKAIAAINWGSLDFINLKMCFEVFQPQGQIASASRTFGILKAVVGLCTGIFPVIIERSLPTGYGVRTMRFVIVLSFLTFIPAYLIIFFWQNIWAYTCANLMVGFASGNIWIFSSTMIQQICPNNFLGRVLSFDLGFNLNGALTFVLVLYGPILYDLMHMSIQAIGAVQLITGTVVTGTVILWFLITIRHPNKMITVDKYGNDIETEVDIQEQETTNLL